MRYVCALLGYYVFDFGITGVLWTLLICAMISDILSATYR
ncbi:hypothetical protein MTsN3n11_14400 [Qipengyuania sp. MTN3-11]